MWSPRQVTHSSANWWDLLPPLAQTPDRRDERLSVSSERHRDTQSLVPRARLRGYIGPVLTQSCMEYKYIWNKIGSCTYGALNIEHVTVMSVGDEVLGDVGEVVEIVPVLTRTEDVADGVLTDDPLKHGQPIYNGHRWPSETRTTSI